MHSQNPNYSNISPDILLYALLFIYSLLVILYGIVICHGFHEGLKSSFSLIETTQRRVLVVISIIMMMIILFMGWFLLSKFSTPFIIIFSAAIVYIIIYILTGVTDYFPDRIKSKKGVIVGAICSLGLSIFFLYLFLIPANFLYNQARMGHNYQNFPDIFGPKIGELAILIALFTLAFGIFVSILQKYRTLES